MICIVETYHFVFLFRIYSYMVTIRPILTNRPIIIYKNIFHAKMHFKSPLVTHVAGSFFVIYSHCKFRDGLQQKNECVEYLTCNPFISQPIFIQSSKGFQYHSHSFI